MRINPSNFERCTRLLQSYSKQGKEVNMQEVHSLIGSKIDRFTIRREALFKPLQIMLYEMAPRLATDSFINRHPMLIANTTAIMCFLNLYSRAWVQHVSSQSKRLLDPGLHDRKIIIAKIYRALVELDEQDHTQFMQEIRINFIEAIVGQLQRYSEEMPEFLQLQNKYYIYLENMHKNIRTLLTDPGTDEASILPIIESVGKLFKQCGKLTLPVNQQFSRLQLASCCQLLRVRKVAVKDEQYHKLLKQAFEARRNLLIANRQPSSKQFELKGQSVFERRVQKSLRILGYNFDRNFIVGLSEFDLKIKALFKSQFYPFRHLTLEQLRSGNCQPVSEEQLKGYCQMQSLWYIMKPQKLNQQLLINLNGPYHDIVGDKTGLVRSQLIKKQLAEYHGYRFETIDYQKWDKQMTTHSEIDDYLYNIIKQ